MSATSRATTLRALVAIVLACASLAYGASFDLDPFDSAELALAAVNAGLAHPPGQPAHTMLGWLVTRGPWAPLAALTWLSIIPAALSLWIGLRATSSHDGPAEPSPYPRAFALGALLLVLVGLSPVRSVSARVEVYALAALFAMGAAALVRRSQSPRALLATAALWGAAGATNPVLAAQVSWAVLGPLVRARRWRSAIALGVGAVTLTLGAYAYAFAARARETQTLVWSAPSDLRTLRALLTAKDFSSNVSLGAATWLSNALWFVADLFRTGVGVLLAIGLYGLARKDERGERDPWLGSLVFASGVGVAMVAANVVYRANNPDYGGYVLVACAIAAAGVARIVSRTDLRHTKGSVAIALLALAAIGLAWARGRSSHGTRALAQRALEAAPPRAIAVLQSDHLLFAALYLQGVERVREDVIVLNPGWASSRWAWRWAQARDPSLRVDLSPGRTREQRLASALQQRSPGRAVIAENLSLLSLAGGGGSCPRGFVWSTHEGCDSSTRSTVETVRWIRDQAQRAALARSPWDQRLLWNTGLSMGYDARSLGCAGLAVRLFTASLGQEPPAMRACGASPMRGEDTDLLSIDQRAVQRAIDETRPRAVQ